MVVRRVAHDEAGIADNDIGRHEAHRYVFTILRRMARYENEFALRKVLNMEARWRPRYLARSFACAGKAELAHGFDAFTAKRQLAQLDGRGVAEEEAPAFPALDELIRAEPQSEELFGGGFTGEELVALLRREEVVATVDGLVADADVGKRVKRGRTAFHVGVRPVD